MSRPAHLYALYGPDGRERYRVLALNGVAAQALGAHALTLRPNESLRAQHRRDECQAAGCVAWREAKHARERSA